MIYTAQVSIATWWPSILQPFSKMSFTMGCNTVSSDTLM